jgi:hypothetical protein
MRFANLYQNITFSVMLAATTLCGCGGGVEGPEKFRLGGTVKYDGKPAFAQISLEPDGAKGNKGPSLPLNVLDGKFETPGGAGHIGGPHNAVIMIYDGDPKDETMKPFGAQVAGPITVPVDLPKKSGTHDFDIPKAAPKRR